MNRAIFLCGSSASGKSTIYRMSGHGIACCKATTRDLRPDENEGIDFFVKSQDEFDWLDRDGHFINTSVRYGHRYGIMRGWFDEKINKTDIIIYSHTFNSMSVCRRTIVNEGYRTLTVAVLAYEEDLKERLAYRNRNHPERVTRSVEEAIAENRNVERYLPAFDSMIINKDLDTAVRDYLAIVQ